MNRTSSGVTVIRRSIAVLGFFATVILASCSAGSSSSTDDVGPPGDFEPAAATTTTVRDGGVVATRSGDGTFDDGSWCHAAAGQTLEKMFAFVVSDSEGAAAMLSPTGVFSVSDPDSPRLGDEALDRGTLEVYLDAWADTGQQLVVVSSMIVGDPGDVGVRASFSVRRDLSGQAAQAFSGYADFHCERGWFTLFALVNDGLFEPIGVTECEDLGARPIEGLSHLGCWAKDLEDLGVG